MNDCQAFDTALLEQFLGKEAWMIRTDTPCEMPGTVKTHGFWLCEYHADELERNRWAQAEENRQFDDDHFDEDGHCNCEEQ